MKRISTFRTKLRACWLLLRPLTIAAALGISYPAVAQRTHTAYEQAVVRAKAIVAQMTLDEKISELHGVKEASPRYEMVPVSRA